MSLTKRYSISIERKEASALIRGVILKNEVEAGYGLVLDTYVKEAEIQGFRKGNAPREVVEEHYGELSILNRTAEKIVRSIYPSLLLEEKLDVIGPPTLTFTKLARGVDVEFTIHVALFPKVDLPDYVSIAKKEPFSDVMPVREEEVKKVLDQISVSLQKESGVKDPVAKDLTEEDVKSIGNFKDLNALRNKIREDAAKQRQSASRQGRRIRIAKALTKDIKIEVPQMLINGKLAMMMERLKHDAKQFNTTFEKYLKEINKTEEELRIKWRDEAREHVILEIILEEIAKKESLHASTEEVKKEVQRIMETNKEVKEEDATPYVEHHITQEKVFQYLEELKS